MEGEESSNDNARVTRAQRINMVNNRFRSNISKIDRNLKNQRMEMSCSYLLQKLNPMYHGGMEERDNELRGIIHAYREAWKEEDNKQLIRRNGPLQVPFWKIKTSDSSFYPVGELLIRIRNEAVQDCILYNRSHRGAQQLVDLADSDDSDIDPEIYENEMKTLFEQWGV